MEDSRAGRLTERELIEVEGDETKTEIAPRTDAGDLISKDRDCP